MATQTEKMIHSLTVELATLRVAVESMRSEAKPLSELAREVAVIEARFNEMTKSRELWGQRGWAFLTVCLSAMMSLVVAILGTLLTFYLNTKK